MSAAARPTLASDADLLHQGWTTIPLFEPSAYAELRTLRLHAHGLAHQAAGWEGFLESVKVQVLPLLAALLDGQALVAIHPAGDSLPTLQQLPSITDEAAHRAYRLWLPLDEAASTFTAVARSHRWSNALRGKGLPTIWRGLEAELARLAQAISVAPGSAVVFDHALLHQLPRVAGVTLDWVGAGVPLRAYQHDAQQPDAELIACFACEGEPGNPPSRLLGHLRQNLDPVRPQDLQALRMGILPAIYRPIQDPQLLQSIPKARPGFSKR